MMDMAPSVLSFSGVRHPSYHLTLYDAKWDDVRSNTRSSHCVFDQENITEFVAGSRQKYHPVVIMDCCKSLAALSCRSSSVCGQLVGRQNGSQVRKKLQASFDYFFLLLSTRWVHNGVGCEKTKHDFSTFSHLRSQFT